MNLSIPYILIFGVVFFMGLIIYSIPFRPKKRDNLIISAGVYLFAVYGSLYVVKNFYTFTYDEYIYKLGLPAFLLASVIGGFINYNSKKSKTSKKQSFKPIALSVKGGRDIKYNEPKKNFLVYAGQGTGKTKSVGQPLLHGYIENHYAGIVYDLKDFDYTKAAYHMVTNSDYPYKFYYTSFTDMKRTYRFNLISSDAVPNTDDLPQLAHDLLKSYMPKGDRMNEWTMGGLGILQGAMVVFRKRFVKFATIPHVIHFIFQNTNNRLIKLLESDNQSRALASAFLEAKDAPKQMTGYRGSLSTYLGMLAYNRNICYVLSGNDFKFNLVDPEDPKLFAVSNSYSLMDVLGPIMGMIVKLSSRNLTMKNKIPIVYFLDEATTFNIDNFEEMPSILREYEASFVFITQSSSKISDRYGENALSSMESNFNNLIIGRTKDTKAQKRYVNLFKPVEEVKKSYSKSSNTHGSSRGITDRVEKVPKYDPSFFGGLDDGEFVGFTTGGNYDEFHVRLNMYDLPSDIELPIVRNVDESDIEKQYNQIINEVKFLKI